MDLNSVLPLFALEKATGEIVVYSQPKDLEIFAAEFSDSLDDEFRFWDRAGYPVRFGHTVNVGLTFSKESRNESQELRSCLLKYAEKHAAQANTGSETLSGLYESIIASMRKKAR